MKGAPRREHRGQGATGRGGKGLPRGQSPPRIRGGGTQGEPRLKEETVKDLERRSADGGYFRVEYNKSIELMNNLGSWIAMKD